MTGGVGIRVLGNNHLPPITIINWLEPRGKDQNAMVGVWMCNGLKNLTQKKMYFLITKENLVEVTPVWSLIYECQFWELEGGNTALSEVHLSKCITRI